MVTRTELAVAAVCAAWAAAFLAGEGAEVAVAPLLGLAVLPFRSHPILAALAVAAVTLATFALGVSEENPAALAAVLTVTYALGRHAPGAKGYVPVLALAIALTIFDGSAWIDVVFVGSS